MIFVLDTNVLVSAVLKPAGTPRNLVDLWLQDTFEIAVSDAILQEYRDVLSRPKFTPYIPSPNLVVELFEKLESSAEYFPGLTPVSPIRQDRSDEKFLSCAIEAQAEALITGDHKHLLPIGEYEGVRILPPVEALAWLQHLSKPAAA
jgi:putative PIN family toxin of toxin-antitoxin system